MVIRGESPNNNNIVIAQNFSHSLTLFMQMWRLPSH